MVTRERECREMLTRARYWKKKRKMRKPFKTSCKLESKVTNVVLYLKLQENRIRNVEFYDEYGMIYVSSLFILE